MFYSDKKTDFREEKITSAMFYGDIKLILEKKSYATYHKRTFQFFFITNSVSC